MPTIFVILVFLLNEGSIYSLFCSVHFFFFFFLTTLLVVDGFETGPFHSLSCHICGQVIFAGPNEGFCLDQCPMAASNQYLAVFLLSCTNKKRGSREWRGLVHSIYLLRASSFHHFNFIDTEKERFESKRSSESDKIAFAVACSYQSNKFR